MKEFIWVRYRDKPRQHMASSIKLGIFSEQTLKNYERRIKWKYCQVFADWKEWGYENLVEFLQEEMRIEPFTEYLEAEEVEDSAVPMFVIDNMIRKRKKDIENINEEIKNLEEQKENLSYIKESEVKL